MQLASCVVCLTKENYVPKPSVTPPEVAILRHIHMKNFGGDPITELKIKKREEVKNDDGDVVKVKNRFLDEKGNWTNFNPMVEIARLKATYGGKQKGHTYLEELYPGVTQNPRLLPQTFDEVKFIPQQMTVDGQAPSRIVLPGAPGNEELEEGKEPVKFEPPVPQDADETEPVNA